MFFFGQGSEPDEVIAKPSVPSGWSCRRSSTCRRTPLVSSPTTRSPRAPRFPNPMSGLVGNLSGGGPEEGRPDDGGLEPLDHGQRAPPLSRYQPVPTSHASQPQKVLPVRPKGLQSFDQGDADFFLQLLPRPRDKNGLPDSLLYWKSRIEERDADCSFRVGVIWGL